MRLVIKLSALAMPARLKYNSHFFSNERQLFNHKKPLAVKSAFLDTTRSFYVKPPQLKNCTTAVLLEKNFDNKTCPRPTLINSLYAPGETAVFAAFEGLERLVEAPIDKLFFLSNEKL